MDAGRDHVGRGIGRRAGYAFIAGIVILLVAELGLAVWARYLRAPHETYDPIRGTRALVPGTHTTRFGHFTIDAQGFVARAPEPATDRPHSPPLPRFRVLAIGDSCTFGAADSETPYPAQLERRLRLHPPAPFDYQVINAGVEGLDSTEALGRLDYALEAVSPDVVLLYLGWNDLMKVAPRSQTRASPLSGLWRSIDSLWLVRGARKLVYFHLRARSGTPGLGAASTTGRFDGFRPSYFEENLHALIERARAAGARPVLLTLPHSLRPDLDRAAIATRLVQFPYFQGGDQLGDFLALIERYNEAIRRVGDETGVPIVDLARRFAGITDPSVYFTDTLHPNARGNTLIAEAIERKLPPDLLQSSSAPTDPNGRVE